MNEVKPSAAAASVNSDSRMREDIETLKEDLKRLRSDVSETARHAAQAARDGAQQAKARAGQAYDYAKEKAGEAYEVARDRAKDASHRVERNIEDHPFMAVGIAFGAGVLLGVLLRSRD